MFPVKVCHSFESNAHVKVCMCEALSHEMHWYSQEERKNGGKTGRKSKVLNCTSLNVILLISVLKLTDGSVFEKPELYN